MNKWSYGGAVWFGIGTVMI